MAGIKTTAVLVLFVNGQKVTETDVDPSTTLIKFLRDRSLTGTKAACNSGRCGACTVMVSRYDWETGMIRHRSVVSCLVPVCSLHGCAVTTVEGVGSIRTSVHLVQERLALFHGTQCGFCIPGMVMSMYTLLRNYPNPSKDQIERALEGNLCRCTGYRAILDGFYTFAKDNTCPLGADCCQNKNQPMSREQKVKIAIDRPYEPLQEPIFPSELQRDNDYRTTMLEIEGKDITWIQPTSLEQLLQIKADNPKALIVAGNTQLARRSGLLICLSSVSELCYLKKTANVLEIGAGSTLSRLEEDLLELKRDELVTVLLDVIRGIGARQIQNMATVGGALMSPRSDLATMLSVCDAVCYAGAYGRSDRKMPIKSLSENGLEDGEVLLKVELPMCNENTLMWWYKHSERGTFDTAIISMAAKATVNDDGPALLDISIGGLARNPCFLQHKLATESGERNWETYLMQEYKRAVMPILPPGITDYQEALVIGLFFKCVCKIRQKEQPELLKGPYKSTQIWEAPSPDQPLDDAVGRPVVHQSAIEHATGEAVYIDDLPRYADELHVALVTSSRPHAKITSIDTSKALSMPGVLGFLSYTDIPGNASPSFCDEIFAKDKVTCVGQLIGAVVARTKQQAQQARRHIEVQYEDLSPVILSIEEAFASKSFLGEPVTREFGNVDKVFPSCDHVIEGEISLAPQEHLYMETHRAMAVPEGEKGEMTLYSSTQNPTHIQHTVAEMLGISDNKINIKVKRIGGGFGGKEIRGWLAAAPCALAASKFNKPTRLVLDRNEDMRVSGSSHGMLGKYKVGFSSSGQILGAELTMKINGGHIEDLSPFVLLSMVQNGEHCYKIPNLRIIGYACRTNLPSSTAFRGFGFPKVVLLHETMVREVASFLDMPLHELQKNNLIYDGVEIFPSITVENCTLGRCWEQCIEQSIFHSRLEEVEEFNRNHKFQKKGIALAPVKHIVGDLSPPLKQAGALVHVYAADGSVLLSHGGIEMGQGLHTKMAQVASRALGISLDKIHTSGNSTYQVPNAIATMASQSSDLNGMAVQCACKKLLERLAPFKAANPKGTWEEWVSEAFSNQISLSTGGYYGGRDFYYTYGVGCSEVQVDCLTGAHQVLRTDIVMDVGKSLNPAIDIGQIEGAFVQSYGRLMLEEMTYDTSGALINKDLSRYKIPTIGNIPREFNVTLLKDSQNVKAVYSSKGIGEPPFHLANSVIHAVKSAISAVRKQNHVTGSFRLDCPATAERIRMACGELFTAE